MQAKDLLKPQDKEHATMLEQKLGEPKSYYLKTGIIFFLLFVESLYLSKLLLDYSVAQDYFSIQTVLFVKYVLVSLALVYTYALSVGSWEHHDHYFLVAAPIAFGIFANLMILNLTQALVFTFLAFLFISYYMKNTNKLRKILLVFSAPLLLKTPARTLIMLFSFLAGFMVFLNYYASHSQKLSIGSQIGNLAEQQILSNQNIFKQVVELDIPIKETVAGQVDDLVQPYKQFVPSVVGFLVFGVFQFLGWISYGIYVLTIELVFWIAKRAGLYRIEYVDVRKEELTF